MQEAVIKRTTATDPHFIFLIHQLDHELWVELNENQATYDQYNKVPGIQTAVIAYINKEPVACGCFKDHGANTAEIKRMFVQKPFRRMGLSKLVLQELEQWAAENNRSRTVLETSIHFTAARSLYTANGYRVIRNYPPYTNLPESVCMAKELARPL